MEAVRVSRRGGLGQGGELAYKVELSGCMLSGSGSMF